MPTRSSSGSARRRNARAAAADTVRDRRIFGVWNAEEEPPGIGLKLADLGNGRYRLEGGKLFCSGLGRVTRPIIGGRWEGGGWQMCLVPMDEIAARVDHRWWQPIGMESTVSGAIDLTGIELSNDTLLGAPDDYYREPGFNGGAIRFAAVQLGGAEALYDAARAYLQSGKRTDHPSQRIRAAESALRIESGDLWLRGGRRRDRASAPGSLGNRRLRRDDAAGRRDDLPRHDPRGRAHGRRAWADAPLPLRAHDPRFDDVSAPARARRGGGPGGPPRSRLPRPRPSALAQDPRRKRRRAGAIERRANRRRPQIAQIGNEEKMPARRLLFFLQPAETCVTCGQLPRWLEIP